jgi:hypothetical protein
MKKWIRGALLLTLLAMATVAGAVAPSGASATPQLVYGDRTEIVVPFSLLQQLNPADMTINVIAPATIGFPYYPTPIPVATFPISGGLVDDGTMIGTVNHSGGQQFIQYDPPRENVIKTLDVTNLRIVNGNQLWGDTAGLIPGPAADLTNTSFTTDTAAGQIIYHAEAHMNSVAAEVLNLYFNTDVFFGGQLIGTLTSWINTRPPTPPGTGYARPKAATPINVSLVPAYQDCTTPNRTHNYYLIYQSCAPPVAASGSLTTGTPDANAQAAQFVGNVRLTTLVGDTTTPVDEADVNIGVSATDVRNRDASLSDYQGELQLRLPLRITDSANGDAGNEQATVQDTTLDVAVPCIPTPLDTIGSACNVTTTADTVAPGAVTEGKRSIWETNQLKLYDGGSTGQAGAPDATVFATQGVFVP